MTTLYLITHADTQAIPEDDARGWSLSEVGEAQAIQLAAQPFWADIHQIVVSREPKTMLTVQPLLEERSIPVQIDARFDELQRGGWVDNYADCVAQVFTKPDEPACEWETANNALSRFLNGIADLRGRYRGKRVALVGHGLTFSLYRAHLLNQTTVNFADWRQLSFAAVAVVELRDGVHGDPLPGQLVQDFVPVAGYMGRG